MLNRCLSKITKSYIYMYTYHPRAYLYICILYIHTCTVYISPCNLRLHWPWQRAKAGGNLFVGQRRRGTAPVSRLLSVAGTQSWKSRRPRWEEADLSKLLYNAWPIWRPGGPGALRMGNTFLKILQRVYTVWCWYQSVFSFHPIYEILQLRVACVYVWCCAEAAKRDDHDDHHDHEVSLN